jgi:hypothetical protein
LTSCVKDDLFVFFIGCLWLTGEVTGVGDIGTLNPLEMSSSSMWSSTIGDLRDASGVRSGDSVYMHISVGDVLLVRYGKRWTHELDDLSHRRARQADRSGVVLGCSKEGWIDTEVD